MQALNNLFERPLVAAQAGGRAGGAASVTPAGQALITAFRRVEAELSQIVEQLEGGLGQSDAAFEQLARSLTMKTSARNALRGVVSEVKVGAVNAEVVLKVADTVPHRRPWSPARAWRTWSLRPAGRPSP